MSFSCMSKWYCLRSFSTKFVLNFNTKWAQSSLDRKTQRAFYGDRMEELKSMLSLP